MNHLNPYLVVISFVLMFITGYLVFFRWNKK
ncbi:MAG: hypothetical protein ACD_12C00086G0012 [uncultured bacterium]|nr:MAG: hypothetical protein ACD_12C00086G0012 [uncultured bacterium]